MDFALTLDFALDAPLAPHALNKHQLWRPRAMCDMEIDAPLARARRHGENWRRRGTTRE